MCKCNPHIRTPFCGSPGCEWPAEQNYGRPQFCTHGRLAMTCETCEVDRLKARVEELEKGGVVVLPDTHKLVPISALKWLYGEEGTFEPPADQWLFRGKVPQYWWRSEFRRRCGDDVLAVAPGNEGEVGNG